MTPAEKWGRSSSTPLDTVDPARLRWMLADQTRKVLKDGIHFGGAAVVAPELARIGGETVEVRNMPHDLRRIEVFTRHGWLCTAYPQDTLTREQSEALITMPSSNHRSATRGQRPRPSTSQVPAGRDAASAGLLKL